MFVAGLAVGMILMYFLFPNQKKSLVKENPVKEIIFKDRKVVDTLYIDREIYVKEDSDTDSLTDRLEDDLNVSIENDTISDSNKGAIKIDDEDYETSDEGEDEELIITDQLIERLNVTVKLIENDSLDISDELKLSAQSFGNSITIEYWSSPLDLTGYELSKNKLKLFGFNNSDVIEISRVKNSDILNVKIGDINLKLEKTNRFKTLYP